MKFVGKGLIYRAMKFVGKGLIYRAMKFVGKGLIYRAMKYTHNTRRFEYCELVSMRLVH